MDIHSANANDVPARQPLLVRCGNGSPVLQKPELRDWKTINRDISSVRAPAPQAMRPIEDEEPERWDGMG